MINKSLVWRVPIAIVAAICTIAAIGFVGLLALFFITVAGDGLA